MWLVPFMCSSHVLCAERDCCWIGIFYFQRSLWSKIAKRSPKCLTVRLMLDFDAFINKSKRCCASWANPTPKHNEVELLPSSILQLNSIVVSIVEQLDCEILPLIMSGPFTVYCYPYLKFSFCIGHRMILAMFHFLTLVSKELFHNLPN